MQQVTKYPGRKRSFFLFRQPRSLTKWAISWQGVLFSLLSVGVVTFILYQSQIAAYNVNMVYILLTLAATVLFGLSTGVLTAVASFLCFDYLFIDPFYTLFENFQDFVTVILFLSTALITNQLVGWARLHSFQADTRSREVTSLYELARTVISYVDRGELLRAVLAKVAANFEAGQCYLFLPEENSPDTLFEAARIVNSPSNERPDLKQAQAIFDNQPTAGFSLSGADFPRLPEDESGRIVTVGPVTYLPLQTTKQRLGVLALVNLGRPENPDSLAVDQRLLVVFANHVALAVEHARLIRETTKIEALKESDKLKSALLASVSHDLRTPLTAIKTATSSLLDKEIAWTEQGRDEFLSMIDLEINRLTGLVSNLLDLSRIESGALQPNFGWYYLPEIIEGVAERLKNTRIIQAHPVTVSFAPDVPLTQMDFLQIDQVLTNLLENAAKYSAPGQPITVEVEQIEIASSENAVAENGSQSVLQVNVTDRGFGIQPEEQDRIFEKFYRGRVTGSNLDMPGAGIGLAIAKGIVEAHGGIIRADRHPENGTIFSFTLPVVNLPADEELT